MKFDAIGKRPLPRPGVRQAGDGKSAIAQPAGEK
jgi:hypothetical protein